MAQLYDEDYYVILRTGSGEEFVTRPELDALLAEVVASVEGLSGDALRAKVKHLIDTACEYATGPDEYLEWYATRLEKG